MLRVILNRLKNEAEEHLAEEQAGFRPGRSTVEQIFNCHIMMEKHLQHQKKLYHNFIDFKKAFDSVDRSLLFYKLSEIGICGSMYKAIAALYSNPRSRIILNEES